MSSNFKGEFRFNTIAWLCESYNVIRNFLASTFSNCRLPKHLEFLLLLCKGTRGTYLTVSLSRSSRSPSSCQAAIASNLKDLKCSKFGRLLGDWDSILTRSNTERQTAMIISGLGHFKILTNNFNWSGHFEGSLSSASRDDAKSFSGYLEKRNFRMLQMRVKIERKFFRCNDHR